MSSMRDFDILLKHRSAAYFAMTDAYDPLHTLTPGSAAYRKAEKHLDTCIAVHAALEAVVKEICPDEEPAAEAPIDELAVEDLAS